MQNDKIKFEKCLADNIKGNAKAFYTTQCSKLSTKEIIELKDGDLFVYDNLRDSNIINYDSLFITDDEYPIPEQSHSHFKLRSFRKKTRFKTSNLHQPDIQVAVSLQQKYIFGNCHLT